MEKKFDLESLEERVNILIANKDNNIFVKNEDAFLEEILKMRNLLNNIMDIDIPNIEVDFKVIGKENEIEKVIEDLKSLFNDFCLASTYGVGNYYKIKDLYDQVKGKFKELKEIYNSKKFIFLADNLMKLVRNNVIHINEVNLINLSRDHNYSDVYYYNYFSAQNCLSPQKPCFFHMESVNSRIPKISYYNNNEKVVEYFTVIEDICGYELANRNIECFLNLLFSYLFL